MPALAVPVIAANAAAAITASRAIRSRLIPLMQVLHPWGPCPMVSVKPVWEIGHPSIQVWSRIADSAPVKRARTQARKLLEKVGLGSQAALHPAIDAALERHEAAQCAPVEQREWRAEVVLAATTLLVAVPLAIFAPSKRPFEAGPAGAPPPRRGAPRPRPLFHPGRRPPSPPAAAG